MITDYYVIRKQQLVTDELYSHTGRYSYKNGVNAAAVVAFIIGVLPNIPGFLLQVKAVSSDTFPTWISQLYYYAWFIGFFLSGFVYWILMKNKNNT